MIQVIEHGEKYREIVCPECECKFSFGETDVETICEENFVRCPECGKPISTIYHNKGLGWTIRNQLYDFKTIVSYKKWSETHDDEIYGIVLEDDVNEVLFDVTEDDFNEMVDEGIVNSNGCYYLLNHPTLEQIEKYAERWGIKWTD